MAKHVRIHDVARAAGVSISTVSRVLNGNGSVNPEMATAVWAAAERLGYQPNALAQGLASGAYRTVGVVVPDLANPYFTDILDAIVSAASTLGHRVVVSDTRGDPAEELNACLTYGRFVDGLILVSSRLAEPDLARLAAGELRIVLVNRHEPTVALPTVLAETRQAMTDLCRHLADLGHRRVIYLAGGTNSWQNQQRRSAVEDAGALGLEITVVPAGSSIRSGHAAADAALAIGPTAIMAFNDLAAIGVMTRLAERGVRVPEDISITGFDDIEMAQYYRPSLTTAISPKTQLGEAAWQALRQALAGEAPAEPIRLDSPVVIRHSTGPAAG